MRSHFLPLQTLLLAFSGWTSRRQQEVIEYLTEENRVHTAGMTTNPDDRYMADAARGLHRFLDGKRFLLCDRDTKYSRRFVECLPQHVQILRTPFQAPNANAHAERFMRSIKSECLDRMIWFGEQPLRRAIFEYLEHYHRERNHQGLKNELIEPRPALSNGDVVCRERLGGLLKHYERAA